LGGQTPQPAKLSLAPSASHPPCAGEMRASPVDCVGGQA